MTFDTCIGFSINDRITQMFYLTQFLQNMIPWFLWNIEMMLWIDL